MLVFPRKMTIFWFVRYEKKMTIWNRLIKSGNVKDISLRITCILGT